MGQVADQLAIELLMLQNFFFADNFHLLILLVKLQRQSLTFSGRHRASRMQDDQSSGFQRQFIFTKTGVVFDGLVEHGKKCCVAHVG